MGSITAYPQNPAEDATSLVVYQGVPNRSVTWTLTGSGTLTVLNTVTDASGTAAARYTPGTLGDTVIVGVEVGT